MTDKPFGVNLTILPMLIPADYDGYVQVVCDERVAMLEVAGGSPKKYIDMLHAAGVKVLHKSATVRHAIKAQEIGVDLVEIVGYEASIAGGRTSYVFGLTGSCISVDTACSTGLVVVALRVHTVRAAQLGRVVNDAHHRVPCCRPDTAGKVERIAI